jgi:asparagine synthase (glutamine-hydrolysing)
MCGLSAIAGPSARDELVAAMNRRMAHRGPDGDGTWRSPCGRIVLGHRRLAILDLSSRGLQPFGDDRSGVAVVHNGEIYNYRVLRRELERRGRSFRSTTDTEVLLHLYLERGEAMLDELNGMFAFAVCDGRTGRLFAARDRTGIKPLYYATLPDGGLALASELKALLELPGVDRSLDLEAIADYLRYQFIPDPRTPFEGIRRLEPGHALSWQDGRLDIRRWWAGVPPEQGESAALDLAEAAVEVRRRLTAAVQRQLVSDRPIGAFLSGGLDSSAVVAAMAHALDPSAVRCYTVTYAAEDNRIDPFEADVPHARSVSRALGVPLDVFEVRADASSHWPALVETLDEPLADPAAVNCHLIARRAREDGTVVLLSGQGADELFGGYRRHVAGRLLTAADRLPGPAVAALTGAGQRIPGGRPGRTGAALRRSRKLLEAAAGDADARFLRLSSVAPEPALRQVLAPEVRAALRDADPLASGRALLGPVAGADPIDRMLFRDLKTYLPAQNLHYTDRATMAAGVEARVPFLDDDVLDLALRLPPSLKLRGLAQTKVVLREAVRPWLPPNVLDRPKSGFGVPLRGWLRGGLAPLADDLLAPDAIARRGLLDPAEVGRQREAFRRGEADYAYAIFAYLTLELWCQAHLDRPGVRPAVPDAARAA